MVVGAARTGSRVTSERARTGSRAVVVSLDAAGLRRHARLIDKRIDEGRVIPFLGAGANLCDRPPAADWRAGSYLPSGTELARYLADEYEYPGLDSRDLVRVAQYVDLVTGGEGALFDELRPLFTGTYSPNGLHRFLAELPGRQRAVDGQATYPLIVTTNYDDVLERAFADAGEQADVVYYAAARDEPGRFVHQTPEGTRRPIPRHTDYRGLDLAQRPVILKIHGAVDRSDESEDNYVITEDHYVDYLIRPEISQLLPCVVNERLKNSHLLFLGYSLADWNLRAILRRIWSEQKLEYGSWAIQKPLAVDADEATRAVWNLERAFWEGRVVEILGYELDRYVEQLTEALDLRVAKVTGE